MPLRNSFLPRAGEIEDKELETTKAVKGTEHAVSSEERSVNNCRSPVISPIHAQKLWPPHVCQRLLLQISSDATVLVSN